MTNSRRSKLRARRFLLGNPYAHVEQLDDMPLIGLNEPDLIRAGRIKLQNQYAYLDGEGGLSVAHINGADKRSAISFEDIERLAVETQRNLWRARDRLWPNGIPQSPITMLDPSKVCELVGYDFEVVSTLGVYSDRPGKVAVAGQIDRLEKVIRISRDFEPSVQVFTAAHEIGHLILHPELNHLHRDRGLNGLGTARDRIELEADKFAVYFLLPEKLVRSEFEHRFLSATFSLNEETGFALLGKLPHEFEKLSSQRRHLSRRLASAINYNGNNFCSLAKLFGVTVETMAIRLEELDVVRLA